MSTPRFHIPAEEWNPDLLVINGDEAHHCVDVLRLNPGDKVIAFNGQGVETTAEITETAKDRVALRGLSLTRSEPLSVQITLGQAIPKKKNMDLIVQKATELGAHQVVPILSERTVVRLDPAQRESKQAKWRRVALEASKQSGQNWLPHVAAPQTLAELLKGYPAHDASTLSLIASLQPDAVHFKDILRDHIEEHGCKPKHALVLIGPEGDFTPAEIGLARSAGCLPFSLGPIILRTETAALYALSILGHELF